MPREGKKANQHELVRIVRRQKRDRYRLRGARLANHLCTDHQHVGLLAERQHFRESHKDFCEIIEVCTEILGEFGLSRVPHWKTLHKSSKRADTRRLERPILGFLAEAMARMLHLAVDSTGSSSTPARTYYTRVLESCGGRFGGHRREVETRHYEKHRPWRWRRGSNSSLL